LSQRPEAPASARCVEDIAAVRRIRAVRAIALIVVVSLGLASRAWPVFPAFLAGYPGDALWAWMVLLLLGLLWPRWSANRLAGLALAVSFAVESSQALHTPWLDALRATTPGHLVLGSDFDPFDLVALAVGIGMGVVFERVLRCLMRPRIAR
jgi:hypothetical protein